MLENPEHLPKYPPGPDWLCDIMTMCDTVWDLVTNLCLLTHAITYNVQQNLMWNATVTKVACKPQGEQLVVKYE